MAGILMVESPEGVADVSWKTVGISVGVIGVCDWPGMLVVNVMVVCGSGVIGKARGRSLVGDVMA
jgi:hypothetical protein